LLNVAPYLAFICWYIRYRETIHLISFRITTEKKKLGIPTMDQLTSTI